MQKITAIILCVATIFSLFSFAVNAENETADELSETIISQENEAADEETPAEDFDYFENLRSAFLTLILALPGSIGTALVGVIVPPVLLVTPLVLPTAIFNFFRALFGYESIWA